MNSKRILSMVLSMVLLCSNVLAAPISSVVDMPTWWSQKAMEEAVLNDVLTAENNLVRPGEKLTRAEMAQGITNAFGATKKASLSGFTDVPTNAWYYDAMSKAVGMGIISGYGNGLIKPEKKITREEMFTVIYNALELEEGNVYLLNKFNDRKSVSDWAEKVVARMVENRYVAGNAKGSLKPTESITREEFAQVMKNIFAKYYNAPGTYTDVPDGTVIISTPGVILKNAKITGDLIIADGLGTGDVTLDNVDVYGRTLVRAGGENAVKLINDTTLSGKLIINNDISKVKIYNSKSTVKNVEVKTPTIFEGEFGNIEVKESTEVEIKGNVNNLVLNEKTDVKVTSGEVKQIQVKNTATKTTISGEGKVTQVNVNANDVTVTVPKAKVTTGINVTGVIAGTKELKPGQTETVKNPATGKGSGGGGGGGGGSSSGGGGGSSSVSKVSLVYNANGGTGAPATQTYTGKNHTFTVSTTKPTRTGYTFLGWADSATATTPNIGSTVLVSSGTKTIYAVWEINKYTVSFNTNGGSVVVSQTVESGKTATRPETDPTKSGYTFAGWYKDSVLTQVYDFGTPVTGNITVYAKWEVNQAVEETYTITWKNYDGIELEKDEGVAKGTMPSYDGTTPSKAATAEYTYTFAGWTPELVEVTANATYTAKYTETKNKYTVTWKNYDGSELKKDTVEYGATPSYDGTPTKPADAEYTYTFAGWEPTVVAVTGNAEYTAKYNKTPIAAETYTITWLDADGTELEKDEGVVKGTMPSYDGTTPSKAATAEYTYTFAGWTPELVEVTANATYTAKYTETKNKYTVTWKNYDGSELKTDTVEYGVTPSYDGETPTKPADAEYTYTFAGWEPTVVSVTGNAEYTATYTKTPIAAETYTITWLDADGTELEKDEGVAKGTMPSYDGAEPSKASTAEYTYTFAGWTPELVEVTANATYTAKYTETKNKYTVTWKNYDG
ncbi:MAG: hypothetical protein E7314_01555, partial [Clostridiales bacterium]|nr:hypothetical protein [Clostridiales bacterium]